MRLSYLVDHSMYRTIYLPTLFLLTLALARAPVQAEAIVENLIQINKLDFSPDFVFYMMLLSLFPLIYVARKKMDRVTLATILGTGSYYLWLSDTSSSIELGLGLGLGEQKALAVVIWIIAIAVLLSRWLKKGERRAFPIIVKRKALQKQKSKCARCKRKLVDYGHDFDHKNGDRSNNKISNCRVLCTPCHRIKHAA